MSFLANLSAEQIPANVLCTTCKHSIFSLPGESVESTILRGYCQQMNQFIYNSEKPIELKNCSQFMPPEM